MNAFTPSPYPSDPPLQRRDSTAAALFFRLIYGPAEGYLELAWIAGDPDDRQGHTFGRSWFAYRPERLPELLARVEELGRRHGNVYVSAHLYAAPARDAPTRPGRTIVVDDLPAGVDCAFSVQTSPGSRHGYFLLDQDAPAEVLRDLARRAAYALGGDRGGWDRQQLVRVPGTYNTKARHGGRYLVTLQLGTRRRSSPAELSAAWPEVATAPGQAAPLDWPEVEHWLGNLGALIGDGGLPRRVKPTTQTGKVLLAELEDSSLARYIVAKGLALHGYPDAEIAALLWHYCEYRKRATKGTAWLKADIQRIIAKVRAERPDLIPSPTRARGAARPQPMVEQQPARRGRRTTLTPAALLEWYAGQRSCSDVIMLTVAEVAAQLGVSRATVERCERTLRAEGRIERRTFNRRQASLVALLYPLTIPEAPAAAPTAPAQVAESRPLTMAAGDAPSPDRAEPDDPRPRTKAAAGDAPPPDQVAPDDPRPRTTAPETPPAARDHVPSAERHAAQQDAEIAEGGVHGETHPRAGAPPAPDQRPEALAARRMPLPAPPAPASPSGARCPAHQDPAPPPAPSRPSATAASPPAPPEAPAAPRTPAQPRLPSWRAAIAEAFDYLAGRKRITRQMLVMFLDSRYPDLQIPEQALGRLIAAERERRAWERQVAGLRRLRPAALRALSRLIDRIIAEGPDGPQGRRLAWAGALVAHVTAELDRRAEIRDAIDPQRRRREHEEYMELAERAFRELRGERGRRAGAAPPQAGARGGVCPPQPAPTQHELFSGDTEAQASGSAGMIARLKQRNAQRGATGASSTRTDSPS